MSDDARAYLDAALNAMEEHSVMRDRVDWQALRGAAYERARGAQTTADTYPAIREAVQRLGDHHSAFFTPEQWKSVLQGSAAGLGFWNEGPVIVEVFPNGPAGKAGVRIRDVITAVNGTPIASVPTAQLRGLAYTRVGGVTLALQREGESVPIKVTLAAMDFDHDRPPQGQRLAGDIGYLELPGFSGSPEMAVWYATTAQQSIRGNDMQSVRGWIVDVRLDGGGNMYPMLAGVGPILGEGEAGGFVDASGNRVRFAYRDGTALLETKALCTVDGGAYRLQRSMPPVAVLTSDSTASSGEAIVVAFRGRPATRSFGAPTAGVPTANAATELSDGARLNLTTGLDFDRTGRTYDAAIAPEQAIEMDWALFGTDRDPGIAAAISWLHEQPGFSD